MIANDSQFFSVSYDRTTKIISAFVCLMFAAIALATKSPAVGGLGVGLIALSYAYSPREYAVSQHSIAVRRLIGSIDIPLEGMREMRIATDSDLCDGIRLFGSGGLFGYYGLFRNSKLGNCWWYITNRQNSVVVMTNNRTTLFSPDDADGFLAAVQSVAPVPEKFEDYERLLSSPSSRPGRNWKGMLIGAVVALLLVTISAVVSLYSPGPPAYELTQQELKINDRFGYSTTVQAATVDLEHIRVVDIGSESEWRPTARTNGFGIAHYHSGWFRVGSGQEVRMYRADGRRLVLLPPKANGVPILLETAEPEKFVEEVQQLWSLHL